MALRPLDNALPPMLERPKKVCKITAIPSEIRKDSCHNDENTPPQQTQASDLIEYVDSKDLKPFAEPETKIKSLMDDLESKDWVKLCSALNDVRRFAIHHSELLLPLLENVMLVMVKSLKNPRSALCKTAILASNDIFLSIGPRLISTFEDSKAFDQLLLQLLLKASQDKRFVCEEAQKALDSMACHTSPLPLLKKLQTYVHHANLRVRAKAAVAISKCLSIMDVEIVKEFGMGTLLKVAAELLNDKLPEAREAARTVIKSIYIGFAKDNNIHNDKINDDGDEEKSGESPWQRFCSSNLSTISAQSVAKLVLQ